MLDAEKKPLWMVTVRFDNASHQDLWIVGARSIETAARAARKVLKRDFADMGGAEIKRIKNRGTVDMILGANPK